MKLQNLSNYPSDVRRFLADMRSERRPQRAFERRPNPVVAGTEEVIDQPVYDSFSLAANTAFAKVVLFQTPIGQSSKTLAQTNMTKAGQLEFPQRLIIQAIGVFIANNTTPTDVGNILQNVSFTLTTGKKPMLEVPVLMLPAGRGAVLTAAAQVGTAPAGAAVAYTTSNGSTDPRGMFTLAHPITIESGEGFSVTLNPETAFNTQANTTNPPGVGTTVYVILDGYIYRAVQ